MYWIWSPLLPQKVLTLGSYVKFLSAIEWRSILIIDHAKLKVSKQVWHIDLSSQACADRLGTSTFQEPQRERETFGTSRKTCQFWDRDTQRETVQSYQWCLRVLIENLVLHSRHASPSLHGGSLDSISNNNNNKLHITTIKNMLREDKQQTLVWWQLYSGLFKTFMWIKNVKF
jgi:hypothetical protein